MADGVLVRGGNYESCAKKKKNARQKRDETKRREGSLKLERSRGEHRIPLLRQTRARSPSIFPCQSCVFKHPALIADTQVIRVSHRENENESKQSKIQNFLRKKPRYKILNDMYCCTYILSLGQKKGPDDPHTYSYVYTSSHIYDVRT